MSAIPPYRAGDPVSVKNWNDPEMPPICRNGKVGTVVGVQASDEDKPEGPTGPWQITVQWEGDIDAYDFTEDELIRW